MFSFRAHREKPVLIVDIDSGSVAASIGLMQVGAPIRIIFCERSYIPHADRSQDHQTAATRTLLRETLGKLLKEYTDTPSLSVHGAIDKIHLVLSTPWVRSHSTVAEEVYSTEKSITDTMIKNVAKLAHKEPSNLTESNVFESSVTRVQLNGYPTGKPVGKRAHHLSVTVFQSDIVPGVREELESVIHELFPGRVIDFRSAIRAALTTLHERANTNHYLYIAVGSTHTECVAVHKEDTNENITLAFGTSVVTQRLAGESGLPEETASLLRMLMNDTCSAPACGALKINLARLEPELVKLFGDAFSAIAVRRKIPNACFVSAHPDIAPWLEHFFARIDFAQFTVTAQPLTVTLLSPDHLVEHVAWAIPKEDTGTALAAAFVNTVNN